MTEAVLAVQIEAIERGYEYLLAYAAQGRQDDAGTELRATLTHMHQALTAMQGGVGAGFAGVPATSGISDFADTVERDVKAARGAIGLVLSRERITSLLVDNLNASVHLRALLTDLFLIDQAGRGNFSARVLIMRTALTEREDAVVLAPVDGPADAAVIWMHGLGADGYDFVPMIPELALPESARVRFVFPHAAVRPVTVNAGYEMRAWYDIRELTPEGRDDEAGLEEARACIEGHIESERSAGIKSQRIVLAGFSQGGAVALHVGLRHADALAGIIALSCYLPLRAHLSREMHPSNRATPVLMCHGREDEVVLNTFGEQSRDVMMAAGLAVEWRQYSVGHGLCRPEIFDISAWLKYRLGLATVLDA